MKDVTNEYHGYLCTCRDCTPRVPADHEIGSIRALPLGLFLGIMLWALIGGTIIHFCF